jgi:hypothetical protein
MFGYSNHEQATKHFTELRRMPGGSNQVLCSSVLLDLMTLEPFTPRSLCSLNLVVSRPISFITALIEHGLQVCFTGFIKN